MTSIEVFWTHGNLGKLDLYAAIGVPEVWIWRRGVLTVWRLADGAYQCTDTSSVLPGLDLVALARFAAEPGPLTRLMKRWRASLKPAG